MENNTWLLKGKLGNARRLLQEFELKDLARYGRKWGSPVCTDNSSHVIGVWSPGMWPPYLLPIHRASRVLCVYHIGHHIYNAYTITCATYGTPYVK